MWAFSLSLSPYPLLSYVHRLADAPAMHYIAPVEMSLILLRFSYFWAYKLKHLPCQFLISFLLSGFTSQHSRWASPFCALGILGPFHFLCILGPFHSSLPLSLSWVFAKPFGLSRPNYHVLAF